MRVKDELAGWHDEIGLNAVDQKLQRVTFASGRDAGLRVLVFMCDHLMRNFPPREAATRYPFIGALRRALN